MNLEIERKFLVRSGDWRGQAVASTALRQGYLANTEAGSVRVRIAGDAAWLSIKAMKPGRVRQEFEYAIPLADAVGTARGFRRRSADRKDPPPGARRESRVRG